MGSKNASAKLVAAQRRDKVLQLKVEGYRNVQIARLVGISEGRVSQIITAELAELSIQTVENREQFRAAELAKLDKREQDLHALLHALAPADVHVWLKLHDQLNKIAAHRAKLLHLEDKTILLPVPVSGTGQSVDLSPEEIQKVAEEARGWKPPELLALAEPEAVLE